MIITKNDCENECPKCSNTLNIELKGLYLSGDYLNMKKECLECGTEFDESYDVTSSYESTEYNDR